MEAQLRLLTAPEPLPSAGKTQPDDAAPALEPGPVAWRLSTSTRELGRQGIEQARAKLHQASVVGTDQPDEPTGERRPSAA
jgi:hypothetical protein